MRAPMGNKPAATGFVTALLLAFCAPAQASEAELRADERQERNRELVRLALRPGLELDDAIVVPRSAFELDRRGVHYRSEFSLGDREIRLRIGGPIYKVVQQKRFGLTVEFRF